jgi:CDP-diacylglycerol--serine O-phosphatidyltransferase
MPQTARLLVPNTVTAANIVLGFLSMLAAADDRFELAVYLLVIAVLLDTFDGRVARWLKATSKFGQEMDSFSDAVSFCVAPAFLAQRAMLQELAGLGVIVSCLYLVAGVFRLVRFNLTSDVHHKARYAMGVPTPVGAGYVMAAVLMRDQISAPVGAVVVLVMALLMISRLPLPEMRGRSLVTYAILVGIANYFVVVFRPNWYTIGWWNLWNVVILLVAKGEDRRLEGAEPSI